MALILKSIWQAEWI